MHLLWAGVVFAVAAVWGVPIVASVLKAVVPQTAEQYLPSSDIPAVDTKTIVHALIFGTLLALVLVGLRAVVPRAGRV